MHSILKANILKAAWFGCLLVACTLPLRAADIQPNQLTDAERKEGWKLLFDGKTPAGWRGYRQQEFPKRGWVIEEGCLKNQKGNGRPGTGGGDLVTAEKFDDFDFKFEWRIAPGGNSGVKYFVKEGEDHSQPLYKGDTGTSGVGHEYQLLDDEKHPDAKNGPIRQAGSLYLLVPPGNAKHLKPVGEFNQSRIVVSGKHVEHWLNGAKILEYELESPALMAAIAKSKYKSVAGFGTKFPTVLLLQDHGEEIWFRDLKIRALSPAR
jgi:hypothetical protein